MTVSYSSSTQGLPAKGEQSPVHQDIEGEITQQTAVKNWHVRVLSSDASTEECVFSSDDLVSPVIEEQQLDLTAENDQEPLDGQPDTQQSALKSVQTISPNQIILTLCIGGVDRQFKLSFALPFSFEKHGFVNLTLSIDDVEQQFKFSFAPPPPYILKKVHHPLYVNYSLWSALGVVLAAGLDSPDWILLAPIAATMVLGSLIIKWMPNRLQSSAKFADLLVIAVSGLRDAARITATGALFYWTFASYFNGKTLAMNVGASDIILNLATDPYFWITTLVVGLMCGYLKWTVSQGETSLHVKQMEKALRGAYLACSVSTMTIMTFDCLTQLWSNMATSGYGLLLVDPVVASVVASVIVLAAIVGVYYGIRSQQSASSLTEGMSMATKFEKFDAAMLKFRMVFMPFAVLASLFNPTLILVGFGLAISYLTYTHYQEKTKQAAGQGQVSSTGMFARNRTEAIDEQQSLLVVEEPEDSRIADIPTR
ncbi:MAG: hypothetical protein GKR77_00780 [Legionellales bacterium]|nr:hypothetical protein [Legionellales bacterium]